MVLQMHATLADEQAIGVLNAMLREREQVTSYHVRAEGLFGKSENTYQYEVWYEKDRERWEHTVNGFKTTVLMTPNRCYVQTGPSDVLLISQKVARQYAGWFDVRTLGLGLVGEAGKPYTPSMFIGAMRSKPELVHVSPVGEGSVLLTYGPLGIHGDHREIYVATAQGFSPTKIQNNPIESFPREIARVGWKEVNHEWVPVSYELQRGETLLWDISFEWVAVNEALDDAAFDPNVIFASSRFFLEDTDEGTVVQQNSSYAAPAQGSSWWKTGILGICVVVFGFAVLKRLVRRGRG